MKEFGAGEKIYVPGNHDFYRTPSMEWERRCAAPLFAEAGIHLLDPGVVVIGGVRFVGATLWTDYALLGDPAGAMRAASAGIRDHALIDTEELLPGRRTLAPTPGGRLEEVRRMRMPMLDDGAEAVPYESPVQTFSPAHALARHRRELAFLEAELAKPFDGETVLITHHSASAKSVPARFADDELSPCFHSAIDLVERFQPAVYVHGHIHDPVDYLIGHTHVVCNPMGYQREPYNGAKADLVIEIPTATPRLLRSPT
jgi:hypothetical protein